MIDDLRIGHFVNVSSLFKIAPVNKKKLRMTSLISKPAEPLNTIWLYNGKT